MFVCEHVTVCKSVDGGGGEDIKTRPFVSLVRSHLLCNLDLNLGVIPARIEILLTVLLSPHKKQTNKTTHTWLGCCLKSRQHSLIVSSPQIPGTGLISGHAPTTCGKCGQEGNQSIGSITYLINPNSK